MLKNIFNFRNFKITIICACLCTCIICSGVLVFADNDNDISNTPDIITTDNSEEVINDILDTTDTTLSYDTEISKELETSVYRDSSSNYYYLDDDNNVIGYISSEFETSNSAGDILSDNDVENIANSYLTSITDNPDAYTLSSIEYDDSTYVYHVLYYHLINNYKTTDMIYMFIDSDGNLTSFGIPNENAFDNYTIPTLDDSTIDNNIDSQLTSIYGENLISYSVEDIIVSLDEYNNAYLNVGVTYTVIEDNTEVEYSNLFSVYF